MGCFAFLTSATFIPIDIRYDPSEKPDPATLQIIETHDICLFVRKPDQHIEAELAAIPPLAVRCSLKDVVPKNEVSTNCLKYFKSFFIRFC